MLIIAFLILTMQIQNRKMMNPFNIVKFEPCFLSYFSFYHLLFRLFNTFPLGKNSTLILANLWRTFAARQIYCVKKCVLEYLSVKAKKKADLKVIKD